MAIYGEGEMNKSWELGDKLLLQAEAVNSYAKNREGEYRDIRVSSMLGKMAAEHANVAIYVNAGHLLIPLEQGIGIGTGQMTGAIKGFSYGDYDINDEKLEAKHENGVIMAFEVDKINGVLAEDAKSWRNVVFPLVPSDSFVVGMPLIQGNRVMQLSTVTAVPDSIDAFLSAAENTPEEYNYQEYADRIQSLMQNRYALNESEGGLAKAVAGELEAMVFNCPYLGNLVEVQADYIRMPKQEDPTRFTIVRGVLSGVLRKFVYDTMVYEGNAIGAVQAVIYDPRVADAVSRGIITPQEADQHHTTTFVPLHLRHTLTNLGK